MKRFTLFIIYCLALAPFILAAQGKIQIVALLCFVINQLIYWQRKNFKGDILVDDLLILASLLNRYEAIIFIFRIKILLFLIDQYNAQYEFIDYQILIKCD